MQVEHDGAASRFLLKSREDVNQERGGYSEFLPFTAEQLLV